MADLKIKIGLDAQEALADLNKTKEQLSRIGSVNAKVAIDADVTKAKAEINTLDDKEIKVNVDADTKGIEGTKGKLDGILGGIGGALAGGAIVAGAGVLVGALTEGVSKLTDLALEADEIGDNMELAFRQAGLSGKALEEQLDSTDKFAFKLGQSLAVSPTEIKKLSTQVASLSGATGKANEDMTKLAVSIEKASGGAVTGEQAVKIFSRGIADPENAEAVDKLTKKFPALGDALKSSGDIAGKVNASLKALDPTLKTLQEQATGADAVFENLKNTGLEGALKFAGGIIDGLGSAGETIAEASKEFDFTAVFDVLSEAGQQIGEFIGELVVGALELFNKIRPILEVIGAIVGGTIVTSFLLLKEAVTTAFDLLVEIGGDLVNAFSPIINIFKQVGSGTTDLKTTMDDLSNIFRQVFGIVSELVQLALQPLIDTLSIVANILANVIKWFVSLFSSTKDVTKATTESNAVFEGFGGTLLKIRGTISGVSESFREIKNALAEAFNAILSFDLKKAIDIFSKIGERTSKAYDKGFTDTVNKELAGRAKKVEDEAKEEQRKEDERRKAELQKQKIEEDKKNKKSKEGADKRLKLLEEQFAKEKQILDLDTKKFEQDIKLTASQEKRKVTESENLSIAERNYNNTLKQFEALQRIFSITENADGTIEVGANLSKDDKDKVKKQFEDLKLSLGNTEIQLNEKSILVEKAVEKAKENLAKIKDANLKIQADIEDKQFKADLDSIADKIQDIKDNEVISEAEKQKQILELEYEREQLVTDNKKKQLEERQKAELKASRENITKQFEGVDVAGINADLDKQVADLEKRFKEEEAKILSEEAGGLLAESTQIKILELEQQTQAQIATIRSQRIDVEAVIGSQELLIKQKFEAEKLAIEKESQKKLEAERRKLIEAQVKEFNDTKAILQSTFSTLSFISDSSVQDAKDKLKEIDNAFKNSQKELEKQLKNGEISYNEYVSKLAELEAKRQDDSKESEEVIKNEKSNTQKFLDKINEAGFKLLQRELDKETKAREEVFNQMAELEIQRQENEGLTAEQTVKYNELAQQSYMQTAQMAGVAFAQLIAQGQSATTALALVALDGLQSIIPTLIAQIFGQSIAMLGPIAGPLVSGTLTAALYGLVALAKSSVGAETGVVGIDENYKGKKGSTDTIPIWVAKGEAIINARDTAKNKELLEHLNKGGDLSSFVREKLSLSYVNVDGLLQGKITKELPTYQNLIKSPTNAIYESEVFLGGKNGYDFSRLEERLDNIEHSILQTKIQRQEVEVGGAFKMKGNDLTALVEKNIKRSLRLV